MRTACPEMPFGTRAELERWRKRCKEMFDQVMPGSQEVDG